jgi:D-glycero-D-manno-heptose 1,7-bisphosphate phosphatase
MLYLFDLDGTLIEGFLKEERCPTCEGTGRVADHPCSKCRDGKVFGEALPYKRVVLLPGRREKLDELRAEGHNVEVITNQGGVAFGHQTEAEINAKIYKALTLLGWKKPSAYVCMAHEHATVTGYRDGHERRKPSPSMLQEAMNEWGYAPYETIFVGDLPTDKQAAKAANVRYIDAEEFFSE